MYIDTLKDNINLKTYTYLYNNYIAKRDSNFKSTISENLLNETYACNKLLTTQHKLLEQQNLILYFSTCAAFFLLIIASIEYYFLTKKLFTIKTRFTRYKL